MKLSLFALLAGLSATAALNLDARFDRGAVLRLAVSANAGLLVAPFAASAVKPPECKPPRSMLPRMRSWDPPIRAPVSVDDAALYTGSPYRDFMVGPEKNAISDYEIVPSQQAPPGKIDLNNALVTDYKALPGMYPHAAGLIASNGPYNTVDDLFRLPQATARDKELFSKYKKDLIALAPSRTFYERINARQST
jgi:hypothetical protein